MDLSAIVAAGLWPDKKKTTEEKGISELEELGYNLFYIGKNGDLYTCPGDKEQILVVRSDRCSVFDIPLNLEIDQKGVVQTKISKLGAEFANGAGIKTAYLDLPEDISKLDANISDRCQLMELLKPLEDNIDGDTVQFEFIFRNYLTGSYFEALQNGSDPYGLGLSKDLEQWHKFDKPIFTPTTKGEKDEPLNSQKVRELFPEIISALEKLFIKFRKYAEDNGIVIVDTKFEIFKDSEGNWVLGDEVLTPESSRFIAKEDFNAEIYNSMDKQILRELGKKLGWKEQAKSLKPGEKLDVDVPTNLQYSIYRKYELILEKFSRDS